MCIYRGSLESGALKNVSGAAAVPERALSAVRACWTVLQRVVPVLAPPDPPPSHPSAAATAATFGSNSWE
eukprot:2935740-Pyramimonas_sp.AAC.1